MDDGKVGWEQRYVKEISSDKIILTAQELRDIITAAITRFKGGENISGK